jgi:flagellar biosynthetic protein FliQ
MTPQGLIDLLNQALLLALLLAGPSLLFALVVGVFFAIFQAVTSIQEQSIIFVPKIIAVVVSLLLFMGWMIRIAVVFTQNVFAQIGQMAP